MKDIFPKAVAPPKLVHPYGVRLGYALAATNGIFALIHLIRIDLLVPILDQTIPGGQGWAGLVAVIIVLAEVFAIPFALRMRLSTLAHIVSGFLVILAPLIWTMISLWAFDTNVSTGQFSSFINAVSSVWLILANLVWLSFAFYALWALGYNRLKLPRFFNK